MPIFVPLSLLFLSPNLILRPSKILSGRMLWLMRLQHWNLIRHGLSLPYLLIKRQLGVSGYRVKYKADGTVERYMARLVAKRFTQQEGLDFTETFSPMAKMTLVKTLLAIVAVRGWHLV